MTIRSRLRTIWHWLTEPQLVISTAETVAKLAEPVDFKAPTRTYIPLEDAATQARDELELTLFNEFAHRDGLDETNPVINWWGNFILSTVPVAVRKAGGDWEDVAYHDRGAGTYVTNSARLLRGNPVAVRDDHFAGFMEHCRALVRDQPWFYKLSQTPRDCSVHTRMIPNSHGTLTKPNRENKFDWDSFDALPARAAVYKREIAEVVEQRAREIASQVVEQRAREIASRVIDQLMQEVAAIRRTQSKKEKAHENATTRRHAARGAATRKRARGAKRPPKGGR